jgi:hypothetical protein
VILTPERVADALEQAGLPTSPRHVVLECRDDRWLARLPAGRIAWFPTTDDARAGLATERRVLRLLEAHCRFRAPRVLFEASDGAFDVRAIVEGDVDPFVVFGKVVAEPALARRLGVEVVEILADQHTGIDESHVRGWLPTTPSWPLPSDVLRERLPYVTTDRAILDGATALLDRYDAEPIAVVDRVLVHTDVGFHNLACDPATLAVNGIFDYAGAAWADRHLDFRYLLFDVDRDEMLDAAIETYAARTGITIDRERVALYNAACAVSYLGHRAGTPPDERSCGRTLAEDLAWVGHAIARVGR